MPDPIFETEFLVGWGDCDPAGLAYHPNAFRWIDATFQAFLGSRGAAQERLRRVHGAAGFGLVEAGGRFLVPLREGDRLTMAIVGLRWHDKVLKVDYRGTRAARHVLEGAEVRALFVLRDGRLRAAPLGPVKALVEPL